MGKWKPLGSIPFMHLSYLVVTTLYFSHPEFLRAHCTEWLQPDGDQITGVLLSECP